MAKQQFGEAIIVNFLRNSGLIPRIPTGFRSGAQGCACRAAAQRRREARATLGQHAPNLANRNAVAPNIACARKRICHNRIAVEFVSEPSPKVASQAWQPWAEDLNPRWDWPAVLVSKNGRAPIHAPSRRFHFSFFPARTKLSMFLCPARFII